KEHLQFPEKRTGQHLLAKELTTLVHGTAAARSAERAAKILFGAQLDGIEKNDLLLAAEEMPKTQQSGTPPFPLIDILLETGLSKSKTMARKELRSGGIYVNNRRVTDEESVLSDDDILFGQYILLRKGKKNYHLLEFER
ncbi:MAG: tyrosine--tRNA ligase, partial [Nitrospinae bacterium]|nr:tyrosine--tRNA ligase [Nitrospinota bacterium]